MDTPSQQTTVLYDTRGNNISIIYSTRSSEDATPAVSFSIRISNPNPTHKAQLPGKYVRECVGAHGKAVFRGEAGKGWYSNTGYGTVTQAIESWIEPPLCTDYRTGVQQQGGMFKGEARHR